MSVRVGQLSVLTSSMGLQPVYGGLTLILRVAGLVNSVKRENSGVLILTTLNTRKKNQD